MFTTANKTFLVSAGCFLSFYVLYAFATQDFIEGFSAKRPELWTVFRLSTVSSAIIAASLIWIAVKKPFQPKSYVSAAVAGGWWLLFVPFWYSAFSGFSAGLPLGAAVNYGLIAGFFGASIANPLLAAFMGFLALIVQIAADVFGYLAIVGYAGFH